MIRAIIFDSDGMLSHGPRFSEIYAQEHHISIDELTPFFTGPFKECLVGKADLKEELKKGWLERWHWKGTVDELLQYWFSIGGQLNQEIFAAIQELRSQGILCVLATNQEKYRTDYLSKKFDYDTALDKVFSSAYVGHKKSNSEFFNVIFTYLQSKQPDLTKREVLFWDDDMENVEGAKDYGFESRQFVGATDFKVKMQEIGLNG